MSEQRVYIGLVRKNPDSDYWVDFPDFQGCAAGAGDMAALSAKAPGVLQDHIEALTQKGIWIGPPSTLHAIVAGERDSYIEIMKVPVTLSENALKNPVRLLNGRRGDLMKPSR
jgi:predicted RNase H-like HicB family nuclease